MRHFEDLPLPTDNPVDGGPEHLADHDRARDLLAAMVTHGLPESLSDLSGGRRTASATVTIGAGGEARTNIDLASGYQLLAVATTAPARVRLYGTADAAIADLARPVTLDPAEGVDLMFEHVTTADALTARLAPPVAGFSYEAPPVASIPVTVGNPGGAEADITVTFTFLATE